MKLTAKPVPYSSVVGGGLMLIDEAGRARFIINFMGTTEGITKAETEAIGNAIRAALETSGPINVPDRLAP